MFLGAELDNVFEALAGGKAGDDKAGQTLDLGSAVLPPLPLHGGDRNRTSPFAFTGNKFEFRALGSSMSLAFPNTVLNTIAAESIDELSDSLEKKLESGTKLADAVGEVVAETYKATQVAQGSQEAWFEEPPHHSRRAT
jgi:glutamine synthetase